LSELLCARSHSEDIARILAIKTALALSKKALDQYHLSQYRFNELISKLDTSQFDFDFDYQDFYDTWDIITETLGLDKVFDIVLSYPNRLIRKFLRVEEAAKNRRATAYRLFAVTTTMERAKTNQHMRYHTTAEAIVLEQNLYESELYKEISDVLAILTAYNLTDEALEQYELEGYSFDEIVEQLNLYTLDENNDNEGSARAWNIILQTLGTITVFDIVMVNPDKYIVKHKEIEDFLESSYDTAYKEFTKK
jgi:hypothetical protein